MARLSRDLPTNWWSLNSKLGFQSEQVLKFHKAHPGNYSKQNFMLLENWKALKGKDATYGALITAAKRAGVHEVADAVRNLVASK